MNVCRATGSIDSATIADTASRIDLEGIFRAEISSKHYKRTANDYILARIFYEFKQKVKTLCGKEHDDRPL